MELQTISQVSKKYGISMRMLRYYEQVGLIKSIRNNDNSYRFYDETALKHLHFITILRKLRISVKQINDILNNQNASTVLEIFERNISELDEEIMSLSTIKTVLIRFVDDLREKAGVMLKLDLLNDNSTLSIIDSISFPKNYINNTKENVSVEELNKANEELTKLKDVRILYLPPITVASSHYVGEDCESHSWEPLKKFINDIKLREIKPDARQFGINNPITENPISVGFEQWVTIPDDMDIPESLKKINFHGGLYAACAITFPDFDKGELLFEWVNNNDEYESDWGAIRCTPHSEGMNWVLEEQLNFYDNMENPQNTVQIDLLFPIKRKLKK